MSELWICREQTAKKPFRPELTGVDIRTMEELCFYLYQNAEHLDEDVMNEVLLAWLGRELGLRELASRLGQELRQGRDELWCVWFLLKESGMYADTELTEIRSLCFALENKDEFERGKLKADRLLLNKKYLRSIREYQRLIEMAGNSCRRDLEGDIWHNLGVAHAGLFLFPEAAEYFLKAYKKNLRRESLEAYEDALDMTEAEEQEAEGQNVDTGVPVTIAADTSTSLQGGEAGLICADENLSNVEWQERLRELKEEYRKSVR